MSLTVTVCGLHGGDSSPSLLVATPTNRYLFNAGEGLQRFCMEHRMRIVKIDGVFFTRICSETLGGLPGMLLTLADQGRATVSAFGGPGLVDYLFATRHFMRRSDIAMNAHEVQEEDILRKSPLHDLQFSDLSVRAIPVVSTPLSTVDLLGSTRLEREVWQYSVPSNDACIELPFPFAPLRSCSWLTSSPSSSPPPCPRLWDRIRPSHSIANGGRKSFLTAKTGTQVPETCISYAFWGSPIVGRFHAAKAKALGLTPGPAYGMLQRNLPVEVDIPVHLAFAAGLIDVQTADASKAAFALLQEVLLSAASAASENAKLLDNESVAIAATIVAPLRVNKKKGSRTSTTGEKSDVATVRVTIQPSLVKDPDTPGQGALVVACPSLTFLSGIASNPAISIYYTGAPPMSGREAHHLRVVFHLCPTEVAVCAEYIAWIGQFPDDVRHVFLCQLPLKSAVSGCDLTALSLPEQDAWPPIMFAAQTMQLCKLHLLHPGAFNLPYPLCAGFPSVPTLGATSALQRFAEPFLRGEAMTEVAETPPQLLPLPPRGRIIQASPLMMVQLAPIIVDVLKPTPVLSHTVIALNAIREVCLEKEATSAVLDAFAQWQSPRTPPASTGVPAGFSLSFTGTSSAIPCKYRNVSGMFVGMPPSAIAVPTSSSQAGHGHAPDTQWAIVLDPGEGTYGQLCRLFGPSKPAAELPSAQPQNPRAFSSVDDALLLMRAVWVSHLHADHHLGLLRLLVHRALLVNRLRASLSPEAHAGCAGLLQPVLVIGPTLLYRWLEESSAVDSVLCGQWRFVDAEHFVVMPSVPGPIYQSPAAADTVDAMAAAVVVGCCTMHDGVVESELVLHVSEDASALDAQNLAPMKRPRLMQSVPHVSDVTVVTTVEVSIAAPTPDELSTEVVDNPDPTSPLFNPVSESAAPRNLGLRRAGPRAWRLGPPYSFEGFFEPWNLSTAPADSTSESVQHMASAGDVDIVMEALGVVQLTATRVCHCNKAYGLRLSCISTDDAPAAATFAQGWSLVYSGDTRPSSELESLGRGLQQSLGASAVCVAPQGLCRCRGALVPPPTCPPPPCGSTLLPWFRGKLAASTSRTLADAVNEATAGCTLLVHEATFEDAEDGARNAFDKGHSTVNEACTVAANMGARHTILTHFSARYPKVPVLKQPPPLQLATSVTGLRGSTFVAYDLLTVRGEDLLDLPRLLPALHAVFKDAVAVAAEAAMVVAESNCTDMHQASSS